MESNYDIRLLDSDRIIISPSDIFKKNWGYHAILLNHKRDTTYIGQYNNRTDDMAGYGVLNTHYNVFSGHFPSTFEDDDDYDYRFFFKRMRGNVMPKLNISRNNWDIDTYRTLLRQGDYLHDNSDKSRHDFNLGLHHMKIMVDHIKESLNMKKMEDKHKTEIKLLGCVLSEAKKILAMPHPNDYDEDDNEAND